MPSIAIPALGTGNLHYPADVTARVMYDSILEFSSKHPTGVLKDVRFVVYDKDTNTIKVWAVGRHRTKQLPKKEKTNLCVMHIDLPLL